MKSVRLGIIGCGVIGTHHLKNAAQLDGVELAAAADLLEQNRLRAARDYSPKKTYSDAAELIAESEIDAVVVAFPTGSRTPVVLSALEAGKHVLIEKPVAMNAREVHQMINARGQLTAGCCSSRFRFTAAAEAATEFIGAGNLGAIRTVHCRAFSSARRMPETQPPTWRLKKGLNGGGILVNWGVYDIDFLMGITGWCLKPRQIFARTWTMSPRFLSHVAPGSDAETHFIAHIYCDNGTVISLERGEYMPIAAETAWQIIGEAGALRLNMLDTNTRELIFDRATIENGTVTEHLWEGEEQSVDNGREVLADFVEAVRHNGQPKTDLTRSLIVQKMIDGIYESAESGRLVDIE